MKLFVWDFHGVLEKGNELAVREITNKVLEDFGYKVKMSKRESVLLYGRKWYQYFEYLLPNEKDKRWLELQKACFLYQKKNIDVVLNNIKPNKYVFQVLSAIAEKHDQILISNTKPLTLRKFIKAVSVEKFFSPKKAFGVGSHKIKKHHLLSKYLENKNFEQLIYIGDSPEDVELANFYQGITYLYSHPTKKHKMAEANYKINDLREVLKEL